jgi:hypothetical protein
MATPQQNGLESMVYAVGKEARAIGEQKYIDRAHDLEQRLINQWVPIFSAPGITSDTTQLSADMASETGRPDCITVDDPYGPVGTAEQEKFSGGDISAGLSAAAADISSTAAEEAAAVTPVLSSSLKWIAIVAVALAALFIFGKSRG